MGGADGARLVRAELPGDGTEDVAEELLGEEAPQQAVGAEARVGGHADGEDPLLRPRAGARVCKCDIRRRDRRPKWRDLRVAVTKFLF